MPEILTNEAREQQAVAGIYFWFGIFIKRHKECRNGARIFDYFLALLILVLSQLTSLLRTTLVVYRILYKCASTSLFRI